MARRTSNPHLARVAAERMLTGGCGLLASNGFASWTASGWPPRCSTRERSRRPPPLPSRRWTTLPASTRHWWPPGSTPCWTPLALAAPLGRRGPGAGEGPRRRQAYDSRGLRPSESWASTADPGHRTSRPAPPRTSTPTIRSLRTSRGGMRPWTNTGATARFMAVAATSTPAKRGSLKSGPVSRTNQLAPLPISLRRRRGCMISIPTPWMVKSRSTTGHARRQYTSHVMCVPAPRRRPSDRVRRGCRANQLTAADPRFAIDKTYSRLVVDWPCRG